MNGRFAFLTTTSTLLILGAWACSSDDDNQVSLSGTSSVSSSSSSGSTASSSTSSSGAGGLTCSVEYTNVPKGDCDLLAQDCPSGQFCDFDGASSNCVPVGSGLKEAGSACELASECKAPMRCIDDKCSPPCCPATDEPCQGGRCDVNVNFDDDMYNARYCSYSTQCTLFKGDCPEGLQCHIADVDQGLAVCDAPSPGQVEEGGECNFRNDCGESQICHKNGDDLRSNGNGTCRHLCNTKDDQQPPGKGGCEAMRTCTPATAGAFVDLGVCLPAE